MMAWKVSDFYQATKKNLKGNRSFNFLIARGDAILLLGCVNPYLVRYY